MGLKVSIIQSNVEWENKERNFESFETSIKSLEKSDLILLPEMFNTGFSMNVEELAEHMNGPTFNKMKEWSTSTGSVIIGSFIVKVFNSFYNRLLWMNPDGLFETYDKKHLFSLGKEDHYFTKGDGKLVCSLVEWKVCPLICYDLRFPIWCRNTLISEREAEYDLLIFIASWPQKRIDAWDKLLVARAIENQAYVIGVNRIGTDGNGIEHNGHSAIYDPMGEQIYFKENDEDIVTLELSMDLIEKTRRTLPFLKDADHYKLMETSSHEFNS